VLDNSPESLSRDLEETDDEYVIDEEEEAEMIALQEVIEVMEKTNINQEEAYEEGDSEAHSSFNNKC